MKQTPHLYRNFAGVGNSKYSSVIKYHPELENAINFSESKKYPIHNWFNYKQGYSPKLVELFLQKSKLPLGSCILDPFCGVGTTLVVSKKMGYNCIGVDIMPLTVFITNAKLRDDYDPIDIKRSVQKLFKESLGQPISTWPKVAIVDKAFSKEKQDEILIYKERIQALPNESTRVFLLLCLLSIIGDVSKTKKDGGFLRILKDAPEKSLEDVFKNKLEKMLDDLQQGQFIETNNTTTQVLCGDARKLDIPDNIIDCIITSPPYLNKTDYTRVYSLELCLAFVDSFEQLRDIRYNSMRSHVEAKYPELDIPLPPILRENLKELENRPLTNPKHPEMIKGYFEDVYICLNEMHRVLKPNGKIYFVIWNARFSGINFDVDLISAEIGELLGLSVDSIIVARQKGTSTQQNKMYGEKALRESVVVFTKK